MTYAARILDYGFAPAGMLRVGEVQPGVVYPTMGRNGAIPKDEKNGTHGSSLPPSLSSISPLRRMKAFLSEGFELVLNGRGLGWQYGEGVYYPVQWRDTSRRSRFLLQCLGTIVTTLMVQDLGESIFRQFPEVHSPGGSMFMFGRNAIEKYAISTLLHISFALVAFPRTCHYSVDASCLL